MKTLSSLILLLYAASAAVMLDIRSGSVYDVLTNGVSMRFTNALTPTFAPDGGLGGTTVTVTSAGPSPVNLYTFDKSTS